MECARTQLDVYFSIHLTEFLQTDFLSSSSEFLQTDSYEPSYIYPSYPTSFLIFSGCVRRTGIRISDDNRPVLALFYIDPRIQSPRSIRLSRECISRRRHILL